LKTLSLRDQFLAYSPYFEKINKKIKAGLWEQLALCLCIRVRPSVCVLPPPYFFFFGLWSLFLLCTPLIFGRRIVRSPCCLWLPLNVFVLYGASVIWKESRRLVLSSTSCYIILPLNRKCPNLQSSLMI
jgi:hypothetical protein